MDAGLGVEASSGDYRVSVIPVAYNNGLLSRAVIKVRVGNTGALDEQPVVHVTLPKGEDTQVRVPKGRTTWSFDWPKQLQDADLYQPYGERSAETLVGPYTIAIVHGTVQACGGFLGAPKEDEPTAP
ncbi:hypothetical protein ACFUNF_04660 [Streptomyces sp. NPDC057291]|uniref:hypothetical protein n=1 Tax=Streptomyces sp. NPDC057291 TaxID=3346087 RepID=UPI0036303811